MRYPVDVFSGKIQDYAGSRPSAIGKIQVDGELMLTELGLEGDEQAETKIHGGPDRALCHYPREHYLYWAREFPEQADQFVAPAFGENLINRWPDGTKCLYRRYFPLGRGADSGHTAAFTVLQAQFPLWDRRYGEPDAELRQNGLAVQRGCSRHGVSRCATGAGLPG